MNADRRHVLLALAGAALAGCASRSLAGQQGQATGFSDVGFATWTDAEPEYLLYPGDEIEVALPTATELTRTLKVGPDGRIGLPLIGQAMAADRTLAELERDLSGAYSAELVRPMVEVTLRLAGPMKVWVDGEVRTPGVYDMPGDIDAYQGIILAGGALPTARSATIALIRRGPGGVRMIREVDARPRRGESVALRRGDIVFVPRTTLGELAAFFTQVRAAMPIGFSYSFNGSNGSGFANF